jgi:uncharacterized protein YjbI with pentapeptide repeats
MIGSYGAQTANLRRLALPTVGDGKIKEFNQRKSQGEPCQLTFCDFRHLDLRGLDTAGIDFSNCYFSAADLRGIDFSNARLESASINGARISGAFFPPELSTDEIMLSVNHGTRMRYKSSRRALWPS